MKMNEEQKQKIAHEYIVMLEAFTEKHKLCFEELEAFWLVTKSGKLFK